MESQAGVVTCVTRAASAGTCWIVAGSVWNYRRRRRSCRSVIFYANFLLTASLAYLWVARRLNVDLLQLLPHLLRCVLDGGKRRYCLLLFWLLCLSGSLLFLLIGSTTQKLGRISTVHRKFFHLTASLICVSGLYFDPDLTYLASVLVACAFANIECIRALDVRPLGRLVTGWCVAFLDPQQDDASGGLVLTPFYLLIGTFLPIWLSAPSSPLHVRLYHLSGVVAVGVGDSCAAIVGTNLGRHRWPWSSKKTVEGSLAAVLGQTVVLFYLARLFSDGASDVFVVANLLYFVACSTAVAAVEAVCTQMDNVILPLVAFVLLRWW